MPLKFLLFFFMVYWQISCAQKNKVPGKREIVTIYTTGRDSVLYLLGEKFDPTGLARGIKKDSVFMASLINIISDTNKAIIFKPLAGNNGGAGEAMVDMMYIFQKNGIQNITTASIDSLEMKYFNDISFLDFASKINNTRPPETISVSAPTSVSQTITAGSLYLFFLLTSDDNIYYRYDSLGEDKAFIKIKPLTTAKIIEVIAELERTYKVTFNENNLLIKGNANARYPVFKILKEALKQKEIFKFRIVTTTE